jgi:hypothetical protein
MKKILVDLRPSGAKKIISETWRLDLDEVADFKVGFQFILGQGKLTFPNYEKMDAFIGQFTGHLANVSDKEMEKPSKIIK